MKKIILTAAIIASVGSYTAVSAQANTQVENTTAQATAQQAETPAQSETPVKLEELPTAITDALKADQFTGWKAESASLVKEGDKQSYKVVLAKEEQKTVVNFNEDGTIIEG